LSCTDDRLAGDVAHGNHLLLGRKYFSSWNLDAQIATSNHNTVSLLQDLSKVVEALSVLDLGNNLNVFSILTENLANGFDILTTANERRKNHVHIILNTKSKIRLILLREGREIDIGIGEIDSLLGRDLAIVSGTGTDGVGVNNVKNVKGEDTIVNVDDTSWLNDFGNVLVVDVPRWPALVFEREPSS